MIMYTVQPGDTVFEISQKFGVPATQIAENNALENPARLPVGLGLFIPADFARHTVLPGESLFSIAEIYGLTLNDLLRSNPQIINQSALYPGQSVNIEANPSLGTPVRLNGYGIVPINSTVLGNTLPYLSYLSVFDYKFDAAGNITTLSSSTLNTRARSFSTAPLMVLTNIAEQGFSSYVISSILADARIQQNFINNILTILEEENFYGLNIDIEYIYPSDQAAYNSFLLNITSQLRSRGYYVSSALAPKTSTTQQGILYESHDYEFNGRVMDSVTLMTYEWGYTYY